MQGIDVSDIDILSLDNIVDLLTSVMGDLVPEGAIVRILSIGGFEVRRRLLRMLEETGAGVAVEFEIILQQTCSSAKCDESEVADLSGKIEEVTSEIKTEVETGSLTTSIQQKAVELGVEELQSVSVDASSLQISEVAVTETEAKDNTLPNDDDDTGASNILGVTFSFVAALVLALVV